MRFLVENRLRMVVAAADAGRRRPRRHSGHLHKTGTKLGHMTGTNAGPAPSWVLTAGRKHCQSFATVRWWSSCRLCTNAGYSPVWSSNGVAAVCRRPVKDPPRKFGERAFTGFPWTPLTVRATGCRTLRVPKWVRLVAPLPLSGSRERPRLVWAGVFSFLAPALASLRNSAAVRPRSASSRWLCGVWWSSGVAAGIPVMLLCAGVQVVVQLGLAVHVGTVPCVGLGLCGLWQRRAALDRELAPLSAWGALVFDAPPMISLAAAYVGDDQVGRVVVCACSRGSIGEKLAWTGAFGSAICKGVISSRVAAENWIFPASQGCPIFF